MKCKKKDCKNPVVNGRKYCNYHQAIIDERNKKIGNGVMALGVTAVGVVMNKCFKGLNKR